MSKGFLCCLNRASISRLGFFVWGFCVGWSQIYQCSSEVTPRLCAQESLLGVFEMTRDQIQSMQSFAWAISLT